MPKIEAAMRESIAKFLPNALEKAISSYENYMNKDPKEIKDFKAHHDACKVALAHIDLLLKLAKLADIEDPELEDKNHQKILQDLIERGHSELRLTQGEAGGDRA